MVTRNRKDAVEYIEHLFNTPDVDLNIVKNERWHFGKQELRLLMDFIYGGSPNSVEEEVKTSEYHSK